MVIAGPPCQGFSSLGKRDSDDPRNQLMYVTAELIIKARISGFLIENVYGMTSLAKGRFVKQTLLKFARAGYHAKVIYLNCAQLGLAQKRRRILIAGGKGSIGTSLINAVEFLSNCTTYPLASVADVLLPTPAFGSLPNHSPSMSGEDWYNDIFPHIEPGQKLCDTRLGKSSVHSWEIPEVFGQTSRPDCVALETLAKIRRHTKGRRYKHIGDGRPVKLTALARAIGEDEDKLRRRLNRLAKLNYVVMRPNDYVDLARRFNGRFKRLPLEGIAPAVIREFESPRTILHPTEARALTVRECARLQGFDDSFEFIGTKRDQYQLVANAFPPAISRLLANAIHEAIEPHLSNGHQLSNHAA